MEFNTEAVVLISVFVVGIVCLLKRVKYGNKKIIDRLEIYCEEPVFVICFLVSTLICIFCPEFVPAKVARFNNIFANGVAGGFIFTITSGLAWELIRGTRSISKLIAVLAEGKKREG